MTRQLYQRLRDALEACQAIERLTAGIEFDDYVQNEALRSGVQWHLCIAGEALHDARRQDQEVVDSLPEIHEVVGMRNRLIHGYYTINNKIVWATVHESMPLLHASPARLMGDDDTLARDGTPENSHR